jgi:arylsulfatase
MSMPKPFFYLLCGLLFLGCSAGNVLHAEPLAGRKPNVIFIITDDQGYGDFSCHGNPILKTPNLDRLHNEGVRFRDFHVSPTCAPTRSALMTGRHEFRNGITHTILERERLTLDAETLPQILKSAGYGTGIFGKWHLGDEPDHWPTKRGFDEMFIHGAGGIGQTYDGSCGDAPNNKYQDPTILHNGKFVKTQGYCTDVFFAQAIKWMDQVKGKQPFYCHIATNAPHGPLQVRPEDEARYAGKVSKDEAKFFGMIANIDDNVGRLLAQLDTWGIAKDTLVVFINDNGGTVGTKIHNAGMRGQKGTPWQGGTRAASFWRWPGTLKPADVDSFCAHLDFLPTLAELAGAKLSAKANTQVEGRSLTPLLADPKAPWGDRFFVTHVGRWPKGADPDKSQYDNCSLREGKWQAVRTGEGRRNQKAKPTPEQDAASGPRWMLFDLKADPGQQTDVAAQHPEVLQKLLAAYDPWWKKTRPLMINEDAVGPAENTFKTLYREQMGK